MSVRGWCFWKIAVDNGILNTFHVITAILKSEIKRKQKQDRGGFNHLHTHTGRILLLRYQYIIFSSSDLTKLTFAQASHMSVVCAVILLLSLSYCTMMVRLIGRSYVGVVVVVVVEVVFLFLTVL